MSRRLISTFLTLVLILNLSVTNGVLYANENDNLNDQTSINQSQDFVEGFSDVDIDAYEIIDENPVEEQEIDNNQFNEQEEALEDIELEYDDIEEIDNYLEEPEEDIVDIEPEADTEQENISEQTDNTSNEDETTIEIANESESLIEQQTEQSINQSVDEETTIETVSESESQIESQTEETNSQSNADETTIETESEIVSENNHKLISTNSEIEQELMLFTKTPIFGDGAVTYILDFDYYDDYLNRNVTDLPNINKTKGTVLEDHLPDTKDIKDRGLPDGYQLKLWSMAQKDENYGKTDDKYKFSIDKDFSSVGDGQTKHLYAVWDVLITFNNDGHGELTDTTKWVQQNMDCKTYLPVLNNIDGYIFKGWSLATNTARTDDDKVYNKSSEELKLSKPTILYAVWEEDTYDVKLDVKDANATIDIGIFPNLTKHIDSTEYTGTKKYSELYTLPTAKDIKRTGYSFIGWYLDDYGNGKPIINIVANQKPGTDNQFKYYAIWEPNSYAITYVLDGGSFDADDDAKKTIKYNEEYNTLPTPNKKGYKFDAWYEDTEFTTKVTNITKETKAHNHILYAKWEENKYNIKYKISAGGSEFTDDNWIDGYSAPNSRYYTDETILPTADKIKVYVSNGKNYLFKGWSLVNGDQAQIITKIPSNTDFTGDIELFAQWHKACKVTLENYYPNKIDDNDKNKPIDVIQGSTLPLEYQNPTADGKKFDKWTKGDDDFNLVNAINGNEITLKANWSDETVETYKVEFKNSTNNAPDDITLPEVQYIVAGDKVKEPKTPSAEGYRFLGWYMTDATEQYDFKNAPNGALTLYAKWALVNWKIEYELNYGDWSERFIPTNEYNITNKERVNLPKNENDSNQLVKNHYDFKGWYKSINFSGNEVTSLARESGDLKLYAKWELNTTSKKNTINFIPNGADGYMPTQYIFENEENKLQENRFNKAGYNFVHWLSQDGKIYQNGQPIVYQNNNDLILTAIWQQKPQDLYPSNNGYSGGNGYYGGGGSGGGGGVSYRPSKIVPETIYYNQIGNISLPNNTPPLMIGFNNTAKKQLNTLKTVSGVIDGKTSNWVVNNQTGKWQLFNKDGFKATNGFYQMNNVTQVGNFQKQTADTYYFDYLGQMVTGWIQTADNKWYYFETAKTANEGKMITGWKQIDGDYYYFNYDGSMVVNGWTPDGRRVGTDGKLIKLNM